MFVSTQTHFIRTESLGFAHCVVHTYYLFVIRIIRT